MYLLLLSAYVSVLCSLRTTLCVRYKSETVACGLIFMAARRLQVSCHLQLSHFLGAGSL